MAIFTAIFYYLINLTIHGNHLVPFAAMHFTGSVFSVFFFFFIFLISYTQYQINAAIFFFVF